MLMDHTTNPNPKEHIRMQSNEFVQQAFFKDILLGVSVTAVKYHNKTNLGRKAFILYRCYYIIEGSQGRNLEEGTKEA